MNLSSIIVLGIIVLIVAFIIRSLVIKHKNGGGCGCGCGCSGCKAECPSKKQL